MYKRRSGLILGFHGCDKKVRDSIVSKKSDGLNPSDNQYDWLGGGIYFWENNAQRALNFAKFLKDNPPHNKKQKIKEPAVLGAVINLGNCLDLVDSEYLELLKDSYHYLKESEKKHKIKLPKNIPLKKNGDLLVRYLDCAVIEFVHQFNREEKNEPFDSVRGVFFEGDELYPNAGFKEKNHMQVAVRNPNCIKGYFIPRELDQKYLDV